MDEELFTFSDPVHYYVSISGQENKENKVKEPQSTVAVLAKHAQLVDEFMRHTNETLPLDFPLRYSVIFRGLGAITHVFRIILAVSRNIHMAFYHAQRAFYFYVEYLLQTNGILPLQTKDAILFMYRKTIFALCRKNQQPTNQQPTNQQPTNGDTIIFNCLDAQSVLTSHVFSELHCNRVAMQSLLLTFRVNYDSDDNILNALLESNNGAKINDSSL